MIFYDPSDLLSKQIFFRNLTIGKDMAKKFLSRLENTKQFYSGWWYNHFISMLQGWHGEFKKREQLPCPSSSVCSSHLAWFMIGPTDGISERHFQLLPFPTVVNIRCWTASNPGRLMKWSRKWWQPMPAEHRIQRACPAPCRRRPSICFRYLRNWQSCWLMNARRRSFYSWVKWKWNKIFTWIERT